MWSDVEMWLADTLRKTNTESFEQDVAKVLGWFSYDSYVTARISYVMLIISYVNLNYYNWAVAQPQSNHFFYKHTRQASACGAFQE